MEEKLLALWDRQEVDVFNERFSRLTEDLSSELRGELRVVLAEFHIWIQDQTLILGVLN
jgi:hypothetical protein